MEPLRQGGFCKDHFKSPAIDDVKGGRLRTIKARQLPLPAPGKINRYIFSCIQNDTNLHRPVFENLLALLQYWEKDKRVDTVALHLSRITYVQRGLGDSGDKGYVTGKKSRPSYLTQTLTYPPETVKYWSDERLEVAPGLHWCGEVNILPTAERPLQGFESYTGRKSGIFPHVKLQMVSIPSMPGENTKFNYTTGAITVRNYIQRKSGLKAEFHHVYGGLLVEVDSEGNWWCRQLSADSDGTIYDLDLRVSGGKVEQGEFVDSIVWGDVHVAIGDPDVFDACWRGKNSILDRYRPRHQFLHDVLDFHSRSHHEIRHPMKMFQRFCESTDDVREEIRGVARFLKVAERDWCDTIVVNANHDRHLGRWLNDQDARFDYTNVEFWADMWVRCTAIIRTGRQPNFLHTALEAVGYDGEAVILEQDESYIVCPDESGGIECGIHGDSGPDGSRGSPSAFARMGRKMVTAHTHRAGIHDGVYTVGTCSTLRPAYLSGPSSWSHTMCFIYENGKRQLITLWNGRERA
jgi:hypothetical protein